MDLYFFSPRLTWRERFPSAPSLTERDFTGDLFDMMSQRRPERNDRLCFNFLVKYEQPCFPVYQVRPGSGTAKMAAHRTKSASLSNKVALCIIADWTETKKAEKNTLYPTDSRITTQFG